MKLTEQFKEAKIIDIKVPTSLAICNPSLVASQEGWDVLVRALDPVPYQGDDCEFLSSENWLVRYHPDFSVRSIFKLNDLDFRNYCREATHGLEDGRLFYWKHQLFGLFSGLRREGNNYFNTMVLSRVDGDHLVDPIVIPSPHGQAREKNWMPYVKNDELYLIYSTQPMEVYLYAGKLEHLVREEKQHANLTIPPLGGAMLSGSSQLIDWGETSLAVVHHRRKSPLFGKLVMKHVTKDPDYQRKKVLFDHYFIRLDKDFNLMARSKKFQFETSGVEFCAGLALGSQGILLSYGVMDRLARIIHLNNKEFDNIW
ncbi:hypothetical protein [Ferrovum myxofaciens]|jgi:hypothetical protein|uniref:hypothetical protein n=1 Tax=Ferrovum myxofaciens TaxID=416213 RepID=UPI0004E13C63|nr:hypothetical protein [Ferrovum myxofaciens]